MTPNWDAFERDAREATQGEWSHRPHVGTVSAEGAGVGDIVCSEPGGFAPKSNAMWPANAKHIANLSPANFLALKAEMDRMREALEPFAAYLKILGTMGGTKRPQARSPGRSATIASVPPAKVLGKSPSTCGQSISKTLMIRR